MRHNPTSYRLADQFLCICSQTYADAILGAGDARMDGCPVACFRGYPGPYWRSGASRGTAKRCSRPELAMNWIYLTVRQQTVHSRLSGSP